VGGALPAGAVIIRFLDKRLKNPVLIHQLLQLSTCGLIFIAFFIGVGASKGQHFKFAHQWLGLIIFLALISQAGLGFYHHRRFKEEQPNTRRWFTHVHLWLGRSLLFLALINMGLGIQLFGDGAGAQAGWYLFTIALVAGYAFAYWHQFYRKRKRILDSFDPLQFEDGGDDKPPKTYEAYRLVSVPAMNDNNLGTYRSDFFDLVADEHGAKNASVPTVTAVGRPTTASATQLNRRYDLPTPVTSGPFTEPQRTSNVSSSDQYIDTYQEPQQSTRPLTGARALGARPPTGRPQTGRPQMGRPQTGRLRGQMYYSTMDDEDLLMPP
jgi:hypothetical protein